METQIKVMADSHIAMAEAEEEEEVEDKMTMPTFLLVHNVGG